MRFIVLAEATSGIATALELIGQVLFFFVWKMIQQPIAAGYYFVATHGGICGLCAGMQVRIPR